MPGLFNKSFRQTVKDELKRRKNFGAVNDVFIPSARVTSLVQVDDKIGIGNQEIGPIYGFSLGITANSGNDLDSLVNINNTEVVIGTTYTDARGPSNVTIAGPKNMPSPGVTDIRISTNKGLIFKAQFSLKFYGKEQYDALYQLIMRPGMPIAIEFGHARTEDNNTLEFFEHLTPGKITDFSNELRKFKPIKADDANFATFTGFVTNFNISLNDQNEYEANVELTNGLEYMFTLPLKETYMDFRKKNLSLSIKNNFGHFSEDDEENYTPKYDCVYNTIQADRREDNWKSEILWPTDSDRRIIDQENSDDYEQYNTEMKNVYVSLNYLFGAQGLLSKILTNTNHLVLANLPNLNTLSNGQDESDPVPVPIIRMTPIPLWETLRSTNINNVIINNALLHSDDNINYSKTEDRGRQGPFKYRLSDYVKRFKGDVPNNYIFKMFNPNGKFENKTKYGENVNEEAFVDNKGIFVSYSVVRRSFISSISLSDAVISILSAVNAATVNILQLKLQIYRKDDGAEQDEFVIYDDRSKADQGFELPNLYNFFEGNLSEAISYKFDFSLPSSVASTVVANSVRPQDRVTGDSEFNKLINNGYVEGINIIPEMEAIAISDGDSDGFNTFPSDYPKLKCNENSISVSAGDIAAEEIAKYEEFIATQEDEYSRDTVAFKEYVGQGMKSDLINGVGPEDEQTPKKLYDTLPTGANVSIRLHGIHGLRFGDLFKVNNVLPYPYDKNNIFFVTSYEHEVDSQGWYTTVTGQFITINNTPGYGTEDHTRDGGPLDKFDRSIVSTSVPRDTTDIAKIDNRLKQIVRAAETKLNNDNTNQQYRLTMVSGFRSPDQNQDAGGVETSRHLEGKAVDINIHKQQPGARWRFYPKPDVDSPRNPLERESVAEYTVVGNAMKAAARDLGYDIEWGEEYNDVNHFELIGD